MESDLSVQPTVSGEGADIANGEAVDKSKRSELLLGAEMNAFSILIGGVAKILEQLEKHPQLRQKIFESATSAACLVVRAVCKADMQKHHPDDQPFSENAEFRPYSAILEEALKSFSSAHPEVKITYVRSAETEALSKFSDWLTKNKRDMTDIIKSFTRDKARIDRISNNLISLLPPRQGEMVNEAKSQLSTMEHYEERRSRTDHQQLRNWMLLTSQSLGRPLSQSEFVVKALEMRQGNLNQAISFLREHFYVFTRSRNDSSRGDDWEKTQKDDAEVAASNILDQLSEFNSFNQLKYEELRYMGKLRRVWRKTIGAALHSITEPGEKYYDFSLNGRIGSIYHGVHLVELLETFPPEELVVFFMGEYLIHGEQHGLCKFLADLRVVSDLHKINDVIDKFATVSLYHEQEKPNL